jgi:hypothetical protein
MGVPAIGVPGVPVPAIGVPGVPGVPNAVPEIPIAVAVNVPDRMVATAVWVALKISWNPEAWVATLTGVLIINVGVTTFGSAGTTVAAAAGTVGATGPTGEIFAGRSQAVKPATIRAKMLILKKFLLKVITLFPFLQRPDNTKSRRWFAGRGEMDGKVLFSS